jgi:hypothetical protein
MRLLDELERLAAAEPSLFQAQLLREDVVRLRLLQQLRQTLPDLQSFKKRAVHVGWTQGDARTHELAEALEPFLEAVYSGEDQAIIDAWQRLHRLRLERLVGCLATPVPKPGAE